MSETNEPVGTAGRQGAGADEPEGVDATRGKAVRSEPARSETASGQLTKGPAAKSPVANGPVAKCLAATGPGAVGKAPLVPPRRFGQRERRRSVPSAHGGGRVWTLPGRDAAEALPFADAPPVDAAP